MPDFILPPEDYLPQESISDEKSELSLIYHLLLSGGFAALLGWMALGRGTDVLEMLSLKKRPVLAHLDDDLSGSGRFHGKLMAPGDRVSPSGEPAAAWALTVVHREGEKESPVCRLAEVSHLWLTDERVDVPIVIAQSDSQRVTEIATARLLASSAPTTRIPVPIDAFAECHIAECESGPGSAQPGAAARLRARCADAYFAEETRIPTGTPVTIVGCGSGGIIQDCNDGHDKLLVGGLRSLGAISGKSAVGELIILLIVGLLTACVLYLSPLQELDSALREPKQGGA